MEDWRAFRGRNISKQFQERPDLARRESSVFAENENLLSDAAGQLLAAVSLWKVPAALSSSQQSGRGWPGECGHLQIPSSHRYFMRVIFIHVVVSPTHLSGITVGCQSVMLRQFLFHDLRQEKKKCLYVQCRCFVL